MITKPAPYRSTGEFLAYLSSLHLPDPLAFLYEPPPPPLRQPRPSPSRINPRTGVNIPSPSPSSFILDFHALADFQAYKKRVTDLSVIKTCYDKYAKDERQKKWQLTNVTRYEKYINKDMEKLEQSYEDTDEPGEFNEDVAEKIAKKAGDNLKNILISCYRSRKNPLDKEFADIMETAIEKYLFGIGFTKETPAAKGDIFMDEENCWEQPVRDPKGPPWKNNQIAEIETYPYALRFRNEYNEVEKRFIRGNCTIFYCKP